MKYSSISSEIREKVAMLMEAKGIRKTKLGQILGDNCKESSQQQFLRADRFLKGKSDVKIDVLLRLIQFFEKPLSYFIGNTNIFLPTLSASERNVVCAPKPWKEVEEALRGLGFDEKFIQKEIAELKNKGTTKKNSQK